jgi:uncharacterized protein YciI
LRSLVIFRPGPNWIAGEPADRQDRAVMLPHLIRMRQLYDRGALIFGGPTRAGFGGMALMETTTSSEAADLMREDPAVVAGVLSYELAELNPYFDAFANHAWSPQSKA